MSRDDIRILPFGRCHPIDRCAFCGADTYTAGHLIRVTVRATLAEGFRCADAAACARRSARRRQLELFGPDL